MPDHHQVLLIEDDQKLGTVLTQLFSYLPVQVTLAGNASYALERLSQAQYDLVVLDLGDQELGKFKASIQPDRAPSCAEIISLSNQLKKSDIQTFLECLNISCLTKPFDPQRLLYTMEKALKRLDG